VERIEVFQSVLSRYLEKTEVPIKNRTSLKSRIFSPKMELGWCKTTPHHDSGKVRSTASTSDCINGPQKKTDNKMAAYLESSLLAIHERHCTPLVITNLAKKWALYLLTKGSSIDNNEMGDTVFQDFIQEEIKFGEDRTTSNVVRKPISWDQIGGLSSIKEELTKILLWPTKVNSIINDRIILSNKFLMLCVVS